jgi:hypothetical protein
VIFGGIFFVIFNNANQSVSIELKPESNTWQVFDRTGNLIKSIQTKITATALWMLDLS